MAAEELGTTFKLPALAPAPSTDELAQAHASPGLQRALAACDGNQSEAARRLGVSRMTLLDKMKREYEFFAKHVLGIDLAPKKAYVP